MTVPTSVKGSGQRTTTSVYPTLANEIIHSISMTIIYIIIGTIMYDGRKRIKIK